MASLNRVFLIGNLTKDPEVKYRPDGTAVADLRVAVSETYRNRTTGESVEQTCFVDVVVWEKSAENCGRYLSKGSPVMVEGKLQFDEWEAQDGTKRSKLRIRALRVQFLGSPKRAELQDGDGGKGAAPGPEAPAARREPAAEPARAQETADTAGDDDNLPF